MQHTIRQKIFILVVDDDEVDIELFRRGLKRLGSSVGFHAVTDGVEALAFLKDPEQPTPNAIILDLNMPRMSGLEFLEAKAADPEIGAIPVFVASTSSDPMDLSKSHELHAEGYITKSAMEPAELVAWISGQLNFEG